MSWCGRAPHPWESLLKHCATKMSTSWQLQTSFFLHHSLEASCQVWRHGHPPIIAELWNCENTYRLRWKPPANWFDFRLNESKWIKKTIGLQKDGLSLLHYKVGKWQILFLVTETGEASLQQMVHRGSMLQSNLMNLILKKILAKNCGAFSACKKSWIKLLKACDACWKHPPGIVCHVHGKAIELSSEWETN